MPRLYVGRLPNRCTERDIEKFFKGYGRVREINLKNGYGFVDFDDHRDADDAAYELNGRELLGDRIIVEHAKGIERTASNGYGMSRSSARPKSRTADRYGPPVKTNYRLRVENLSTRVSWQDLKDYCRQAGEVTYADAHKNNKREALVCFSSKEDMKNVVRKLDGTELNGRKINFVEEKSYSRSRSRSPSYRRKRSRSGSRSFSRSRSRSPRRSRSRSHSRSLSRSRSPAKRSRRKSSRSHSRSQSRSRSPLDNKSDRSRSRSRSPEHRQDEAPDNRQADSAGEN